MRLQAKEDVMAQFVFLFRSSETAQVSPAEMQARMQKWTVWMKELGDKGHIKDRGAPLERSGKVVGGTPKRNATDGPYAEKDVVMGYTLIEAKDLAHASELAAGCPMVIGGGGVVEVRPVMALNM
jgi:hypothetical protein